MYHRFAVGATKGLSFDLDVDLYTRYGFVLPYRALHVRTNIQLLFLTSVVFKLVFGI